MQWQLVSRRRQRFNRVDRDPGDYFRGMQRRPIINSQNEPQGSVGSPATEWSIAAATNGLRRPAPSDLKVIVVDIDCASIDALGTWPWPREDDGAARRGGGDRAAP
jgi:hypothetical protein